MKTGKSVSELANEIVKQIRTMTTKTHYETKDYVFLKKADDSEDVYYAIDPAKIETLNLFETYDGFGQQVGHYNAGDYHPDNSASPAVQDCLNAIAEKFGIDTDGIEFRGDEIEFEGVPDNVAAIRDFVSSWIADNASIGTCEGFTFWNGHNWQTVIVSAEWDEGAITHTVINDDKLISELSEALENRSFVKEGFGEKIYKSDNGYYVIDSYVQGTWASYVIVPAAEYEAKTIEVH